MLASINIVVNTTIEIAGLGDRLKRLREKKGLTRKDLANRLRCSKSYISHIENESLSSNLSYYALFKIIKAMGYKTDWRQYMSDPSEIIEFLDELDKLDF